MDSEEFVESIKDHVLNSAIEGVLAQIEMPSGRKPSDTLLQLNRWFHDQDDEAKLRAKQCVREGAHAALFGMLCVLDGVRLIHEELRNGRLKLVLQTGSEEVILSDSQAISDLHDIFNAIEGEL